MQGDRSKLLVAAGIPVSAFASQCAVLDSEDRISEPNQGPSRSPRIGPEITPYEGLLPMERI